MTDDNRPGVTSATRRGRIGYILITIVLLVSTSGAMAMVVDVTRASPGPAAEPSFVVALDADGSARVTLNVTFDLATDSQQEAFEALRSNKTVRDQRARRYAARMRGLADRAETDAGREMRIRDPAVEFTDRNNTGIVALSVTWDGLAAEEGDSLVLREPFASEFRVDREFRIVGPEGYDLATVKPRPADRTGKSALWPPGTAFEGFEARFVPATEDDAGTTGASAPGFGIVLAGLALLVSTGLLIYRPGQ